MKTIENKKININKVAYTTVPGATHNEVRDELVTITMCRIDYLSLCKEFNVFKDAMDYSYESLDFQLSDLRAMRALECSITMHMGFEQPSQHMDYQIPRKDTKWDGV